MLKYGMAAFNLRYEEFQTADATGSMGRFVSVYE